MGEVVKQNAFSLSFARTIWPTPYFPIGPRLIPQMRLGARLGKLFMLVSAR